MANVHILGDAPCDAGTYSGGVWQSALGLSLLKTRFVAEVARSIGLAAASTTFTSDMLFTRPLSLFALIGHNFTLAASVRIRVSDAADLSGATLDVTVSLRQPNTVWGSLPWGAFPFDGVREDYKPEGNTLLLYEHPTSVFGRYVRIDILDPTNAAGFVQLGRFMCGDPLVPKVNMNWGASFRWIDPSTKTTSRGGQDWWNKLRKRRQLSLSFPHASEGEAWGAAYELQERLGLTEPLLVVYDPAEAAGLRERRTLYGTFTQLDDVVTASACVAYPYTWNLAVLEQL